MRGSPVDQFAEIREISADLSLFIVYNVLANCEVIMMQKLSNDKAQKSGKNNMENIASLSLPVSKKKKNSAFLRGFMSCYDMMGLSGRKKLKELRNNAAKWQTRTNG